MEDESEQGGRTEPTTTTTTTLPMAASEDDKPMVGPGPAPDGRPKRPLQLEAYLNALPSANRYEKIYTHLDVVTHVAASAEIFITGSADGHLKFWKKKAIGIEFAKDLESYLGPIEGLAVSLDGRRCCTISNDPSVKIYDLVHCDIIRKIVIHLQYVPGCVEWVYKQGDASAKLAVSERNSSFVHIYDALKGTRIISKEVHLAPVKVMKYNHVSDTVISADEKGNIEYFDPATLQFSEDSVNFRLKSDTDLSEIVKCKTTVSTIEVSPDGEQFSITSPDRRICVFWFRSGKLRHAYDESLEVARDLQRSNVPLYQLKDIDFERRIAVEGGIEKTENVPYPNAIFDESSNFIIYSSLLGIKIVNLRSNEVVRILGKVQSNVRFLSIALYQGDRSIKKVRENPAAAVTANESKEPLVDPTLLCCAFKKHRIYMFSQREPEEADDPTKGKDVFNEEPPPDEPMAVSELGKSATTSLPDNVILHTTMGDIHLKLYPEECPKTVENFTTHCKNEYYDNVIFHRVVKGIYIQTGDPLGDGTGGQSIWGCDFEDEFHKSLRHDRPCTLSMVNAGPNTNRSQFFITTVGGTTWLDDKCTVFGRVHKGMDVVQAIENVKTDNGFKPCQDIKIEKVTIPNNLGSSVVAVADSDSPGAPVSKKGSVSKKRLDYVVVDGRYIYFDSCSDDEPTPDEEVVKRYWKQALESEGFDIADYPGNVKYARYIPINFRFELDKEQTTNCAIEALKVYNEQLQLKEVFVFSKLLWATQMFAGGLRRYITFEAAEGGRIDDPAAVKKFQAEVLQKKPPWEIQVIFCRLRKEQEVADFKPFEYSTHA